MSYHVKNITTESIAEEQKVDGLIYPIRAQNWSIEGTDSAEQTDSFAVRCHILLGTPDFRDPGSLK